MKRTGERDVERLLGKGMWEGDWGKGYGKGTGERDVGRRLGKGIWGGDWGKGYGERDEGPVGVTRELKKNVKFQLPPK